MPDNSWSEIESDNQFNPISSLLSETESDDIDPDFFFQGAEGRRIKAAFLLLLIWTGIIALHSLPGSNWLILGLTGLLGIQALRILLARPRPTLPASTATASAPLVSLLVAAKNEEAVIGNLVQGLCNLDYPSDRYELWVIDDGSTDRTPILLDQLALEYPQLKVLHRSAGAGGGKSGALNEVLKLAQGEFLGVFDADAQVSREMLTQVLPLFEREKVGAVQMRKAIANYPTNFWTWGQRAEMALDTYFQENRTAIGGIGELRGNGQFVRRQALQRCGGWNEETITDDLDLTFRLHIDGWDIEFLRTPAVQEEGVTTVVALWHQRNRWAEGGYQRYLDYWRLIARNQMGTLKTIDLLGFLIMQYLLPTAAVADLVMAIAFNHAPVLTPVASLAFFLSLVGMFSGLRRIDRDQNQSVPFWATLWQTLHGSVYMLHWLIVMGSTTARMSVLPKTLKWVKTVHQGT